MPVKIFPLNNTKCGLTVKPESAQPDKMSDDAGSSDQEGSDEERVPDFTNHANYGVVLTLGSSALACE